MANRTYAFTFSNYAAMLAQVGMIGGDLAYLSTSDTYSPGSHWKYDDAASVWRVQGPFRTTAANLGNLQGVQPGDDVFITDIAQKAYWTGAAWSYYS